MLIRATGFLILPAYKATNCHDIAFTYDASSHITQGILRTNQEFECQRFTQSLLNMSNFASHPAIILVASLEVRAVLRMSSALDLQDQLYDVQKKTGAEGGYYNEEEEEDTVNHHSTEPPQLDFEAFTRELSRYSQTIMLYIFYLNCDLEVSKVTLETLEHLEYLSLDQETASSKELKKTIVFLKQRASAMTSRLTNSKYIYENLDAVTKFQMQTVGIPTSVRAAGLIVYDRSTT
jgi:hypothetical protein